MQFELSSFLIAIVSVIMTAGVSYGMFKEKTRYMEAELREHKREDSAIHERMVSYQHFNAIVHPIQSTIAEMQSDIKKILTILSER